MPLDPWGQKRARLAPRPRVLECVCPSILGVRPYCRPLGRLAYGLDLWRRLDVREGLDLDLADALPTHVETQADLGQGAGTSALKAEAELHHLREDGWLKASSQSPIRGLSSVGVP